MTITVAPTGFRIGINLGEVLNFAWDANDAGENVTNYSLYVGDASDTYNEPDSPINVGNVTSYSLSMIGRPETIYARLSATNAQGEGPQSDEVTNAPPAAIRSVVQGRSTNVASLQQTTPLTVLPGDLVVVCVSSWNSNGDSLVVTDTASQTYTSAVQLTHLTDFGPQTILYVENHPGGNIQVTVDPNGSADLEFTVTAVTGALTSGALDATDTNTGSFSGPSGFTASAVTGVLAQADEIIFAIAGHDSPWSHAMTEDTADGFTLIGRAANNNGGQSYLAQYKEVASASSVTANTTGAAGGAGTFNWYACCATFKYA